MIKNSNITSHTLKLANLFNAKTIKSLHIAPITSDHMSTADYLTLSDASQKNLVKLEESSDVSSAYINNLSAKPLFLMNGEILEGAKQNRVINDSVIIPPLSNHEIDVSCVEEGRWSNRYGDFNLSNDLFDVGSRWEKSKSVFDSKLRKGSRKSDQGGVWHEIRSKHSRMGVNSSTSSAKDTYINFEDHLRQYEEGFESLPNQVGLIFYLNNKYVGIELFDSVNTYKKFEKKIIRSVAIDAIEYDLPLRADSRHRRIADRVIKQFFDLLTSLKEEAISAPFIGEEVVMNYPQLGIYSSATAFEKQIIHLTGYHEIDLNISNRKVH